MMKKTGTLMHRVIFTDETDGITKDSSLNCHGCPKMHVHSKRPKQRAKSKARQGERMEGEQSPTGGCFSLSSTLSALMMVFQRSFIQQWDRLTSVRRRRAFRISMCQCLSVPFLSLAVELGRCTVRGSLVKIHTCD